MVNGVALFWKGGVVIRVWWGSVFRAFDEASEWPACGAVTRWVVGPAWGSGFALSAGLACLGAEALG